jgi:hypothetical protein
MSSGSVRRGHGNQSARELADAWLDTAESLRLRFNAAGGAIGKLDKWGMPQVHNMLRFARSRSSNGATSSARCSTPADARRDRQPDDAAADGACAARRLRNHRSDGWNERRAGAFTGSKLANRHQDSRFLVFKDADSWLSYAQKFGRPLSASAKRSIPAARCSTR